MKNIAFIVVIIFIILAGFLMFRLAPLGREVKMVVSPLPNFINKPQELKYDSSTDLKKELDGVNPQVLDSDFE